MGSSFEIQKRFNTKEPFKILCQFPVKCGLNVFEKVSYLLPGCWGLSKILRRHNVVLDYFQNVLFF